MLFSLSFVVDCGCSVLFTSCVCMLQLCVFLPVWFVWVCVLLFSLLFTSLYFVCFLFEINHNFCLFVAWCNFKVIFFYLYTAITNFIFFFATTCFVLFFSQRAPNIFNNFLNNFLLLCTSSLLCFFFLMPLPIPHFLLLLFFVFTITTHNYFYGGIWTCGTRSNRNAPTASIVTRRMFASLFVMSGSWWWVMLVMCRSLCWCRCLVDDPLRRTGAFLCRCNSVEKFPVVLSCIALISRCTLDVTPDFHTNTRSARWSAALLSWAASSWR